jgi:transcriptional regulator with XRE-family HTH domain
VASKVNHELSQGARILQELGPVAVISAKSGVSPRSITSYRQGARPSLKNRKRLEAAYGLSESSWEPPPSAFEQQLAQRLAVAVGDALRAHHGPQKAYPLNPASVGVALLHGCQQRAVSELHDASGAADSVVARAKLAATTAAFESACEMALLSAGGSPS